MTDEQRVELFELAQVAGAAGIVTCCILALLLGMAFVKALW